MLINLAFIKTANGLFHYAMDYVAALEDRASGVLVRSDDLAAAVRSRFPTLPVRVGGGARAAAAAWAAARRGEMVFTPSSHPIPWCSRQLVVVHDSYPFEGTKGAIKAALFFLSLRTSNATVGYINRSDARAFILSGGISAARTLSSPNRMAPPATAPMRDPLVLPPRPVIGLVGADSTKKNYEALFAGVSGHRGASRLRFKLYGQANPYIARILAAFPDLDVEIVDSSEVGLEAFVLSVDIVASAATREGFSRPLALALALGIPGWIVDAPVFREFYGQAARFHPDPASLGAALAAADQGMVVDRPAFALPAHMEDEFRHCIAWLVGQDIASCA